MVNEEEHHEIARNIHSKIQQAKQLSPKDRRANQPLVYGFKLSFGEGDKPIIEEFGNIRFKNGMPVREPLTDVLMGDSHVVVMMELPGINLEEIDLEAKGNILSLNVESEDRIYQKDINLGCVINPSTVEANLKNGVLEVRINRI